MFLQTIKINQNSSPSEIVSQDYRTADVFRKYGIEFCCAGRWPLETVCLTKDIDADTLHRELYHATRTVHLPQSMKFEKWDTDFLIDYIINVHHDYLQQTLPCLGPLLKDFATEHIKKYPLFEDIFKNFTDLEHSVLPHLKEEEEIIFPYLRQVAHAHDNQDSFATLLVKTLRKPIAPAMDHDKGIIQNVVTRFRKLTDGYNFPEKACPNHRVILSKLKELDNDLAQHVYLENEILYPRVIAMEKLLLTDKG